MERLKGKNILITGAASGIGEATARLFVKEGANVLLTDIMDNEGRRISQELGEHAFYQRVDIKQEADIQEAIDFLVKKHGSLDVIYNNAGSPGVAGKISETDSAAFDQTVSILFKGVFFGIKHAAAQMQKQGSGSIISTASVAGLITGYAPHIYSACKAAVIHLTKTTAMELGPKGIRVNCICPGMIATPIMGTGFGFSKDQSLKAFSAIEENLKGLQPIRQAGMPEDIAKAALFLASDDSSFITGHALVVDGGLTGGQQYHAQNQMYKNIYTGMSKIIQG